MHIVMVSDRFSPEINTQSVRISELSKYWVAAGHRVSIVTTFPNQPFGVLYEGYRKKPYSRETINGLEILRVWSYFSPRKDKLHKALFHLSFMFSAIVLPFFLLKKVDIVIGTSPWPSNAYIAKILAAWKRVPFVFEVRDLWPEVIAVVGALKVDSLPMRLMRKWVGSWYKKATLIVTVTDGFVDEIVKTYGICRSKLAVIKNGADVMTIKPFVCDKLALKAQYQVPQDCFIISYLGTMGKAQGLQVIPQVAAELKDHKIHFLLIGDGTERTLLEQQSKTLGLSNISFMAPVPRAQALELLALSDVSLVHLMSSPFFDTTIPSKLFEAMAMAKPILLGVSGEAAKVVDEACCGISFVPGSVKDLKNAILKLMALSSPELHAIGQNGRSTVEKTYNRVDLAHAYAEYLQKALL